MPDYRGSTVDTPPCDVLLDALEEIATYAADVAFGEDPEILRGRLKTIQRYAVSVLAPDGPLTQMAPPSEDDGAL